MKHQRLWIVVAVAFSLFSFIGEYLIPPAESQTVCVPTGLGLSGYVTISSVAIATAIFGPTKCLSTGGTGVCSGTPAIVSCSGGATLVKIGDTDRAIKDTTDNAFGGTSRTTKIESFVCIE